MPEAEEADFKLDLNECRVDVYRSGELSGQSVNTTDSAVRVTHLPTGLPVANQDQKSHKNKDKAIKILTNKIFDILVREKKEKEDAERKGQVVLATEVKG